MSRTAFGGGGNSKIPLPAPVPASDNFSFDRGPCEVPCPVELRVRNNSVEQQSRSHDRYSAKVPQLEEVTVA